MTQQSAGEVLYGARAIADFLGIPMKPVRHRIDEGVIPTFRIETTVCARRSTHAAWIAEQEAKARGPQPPQPDPDEPQP